MSSKKCYRYETLNDVIDDDDDDEKQIKQIKQIEQIRRRSTVLVLKSTGDLEERLSQFYHWRGIQFIVIFSSRSRHYLLQQLTINR